MKSNLTTSAITRDFRRVVRTKARKSTVSLKLPRPWTDWFNSFPLKVQMRTATVRLKSARLHRHPVVQAGSIPARFLTRPSRKNPTKSQSHRCMVSRKGFHHNIKLTSSIWTATPSRPHSRHPWISRPGPSLTLSSRSSKKETLIPPSWHLEQMKQMKHSKTIMMKSDEILGEKRQTFYKVFQKTAAKNINSSWRPSRQNTRWKKRRKYKSQPNYLTATLFLNKNSNIPAFFVQRSRLSHLMSQNWSAQKPRKTNSSTARWQTPSCRS